MTATRSPYSEAIKIALQFLQLVKAALETKLNRTRISHV